MHNPENWINNMPSEIFFLFQNLLNLFKIYKHYVAFHFYWSFSLSKPSIQKLNAS